MKLFLHMVMESVMVVDLNISPWFIWLKPKNDMNKAKTVKTDLLLN